jgi:hypothetical protein
MKGRWEIAALVALCACVDGPGDARFATETVADDPACERAFDEAFQLWERSLALESTHDALAPEYQRLYAAYQRGDEVDLGRLGSLVDTLNATNAEYGKNVERRQALGREVERLGCTFGGGGGGGNPFEALV